MPSERDFVVFTWPPRSAKSVPVACFATFLISPLGSVAPRLEATLILLIARSASANPTAWASRWDASPKVAYGTLDLSPDQHTILSISRWLKLANNNSDIGIVLSSRLIFTSRPR